MKAKSNQCAFSIRDLGILLLLVGCFCLSLQVAKGGDDWKPVTCDSVKPYHGPKLHAHPATSVFAEVSGSLNGSLDTNTVARLEKALARALDATKAPAMTVAVGVPGMPPKPGHLWLWR